ncbi:TadE/TadG family type IV pilus assembly protein [Sphingomicrobium aestuariivivum]|uniref:TadE/TadG family type IV pilus assembly protein n=1 Tax=Sphingomicrobium aestuariivivum TaxID=1582356 RepID=UPI001FD6DB66|nr:TadE/TadG family type IV pilus assembly protein [Sphingomicrobium aestuariivivum]MCJ8190269.1 pilus assembly protein TadG-related protein [Sphingomicrobium aestuariivivum]
MRKLFDKIWNDERGNVLVVMGATLPLFIGAAGLATDTIQWTLWKRQLQRAADSAAIAGVYERIQSDTEAGVKDAVDKDIALNHHTGIALSTGYPQVSRLADSGDMRQRVQVVLSVARPLSFSSMFMTSAPEIRATSVAASVPGTDEYCVISLEDTATTGITGSGNAGVEMDCGMITNSTAPNSAIAKGNVTMEASVIASVGGIQESDNWVVDKYDPYVSKMEDPYANLNPNLDELDCDTEKVVVRGGPNETISVAPEINGDYDFAASKSANGGDAINCFSGIDVGPSETVNLPAGVYYIDGGNVNIQGTVTGTDVTIVLTNSDSASNATIGTFDMNAGASLTLTAPTSGDWAGVAVYQDRRAVDQAKQTPNKINGGSTGIITGVLYFPNQGLAYNGDGTSTFVCTRIVSRRVTFSGNNTTGNTNKFEDDCSHAGIPAFEGGRLIRLVA